MRLIDADLLRKEFPMPQDMRDPKQCLYHVTGIWAEIDAAPTVDERKTGEWVDYCDEGYVECPFCHSATNCDCNKDELHYCFSCGAELRW